jgi:hypothetical protein
MRPSDPRRVIAHGLDLHGVFDLRQHPRTNEDLPRLRFVAEPRGNIGYRPDGCVVEAPGFRVASRSQTQQSDQPPAEAGSAADGSCARFRTSKTKSRGLLLYQTLWHSEYQRSLEKRRRLYRRRVRDQKHNQLARAPSQTN